MKPWKSYEAQAELLYSRGLKIGDLDACVGKLGRVNYYRFSGYARYFQLDPKRGLNHFQDGADFDEIFELYSCDERMRDMLSLPLAQIEVFFRAQYAHIVGDKYRSTDFYLQDDFFSGAESSESLVECCVRDIQRSRELFIRHYINKSDPGTFNKLPVWSAVESFSFGTLSKCIERGASGQMDVFINEATGIPKAGLNSRIKSLVYLRNRWAHHARLWNHSVVDAGSVPNNVRARAKREVGKFEPRSVMDVLVSLDDLLKRAEISTTFFETICEEFSSHETYWKGLLKPETA